MAFSAADTSPLPRTTDWRALLWTLLFFWYFSGVVHLLLQFSGVTSFEGIRKATVATLIWLVPLLLFPRHSRPIAAAVGLVLWAVSLIPLGYFCIYGQEFSESVIFVIFESNLAESSEFLAQYFRWWIILVFALYSLGGWLLWRRVRPIRCTRRAAWGGVLCIVFAVSIYPTFKLIRRHTLTPTHLVESIFKRLEPASPWQMVVGYWKYRIQLHDMQALLAQNRKIPPLAGLADDNDGQPTTLVLVLGESTNRQHMSLYGYPRPTTPGLDAMRDQLTVFNHVVAPRPYTIETLQQVLTFADQRTPQRYLTTPSLMNVMQQAGYKTFWITNQQTMTKRNTLLTSFSQQTDVQYYLNNSRDQNSRSYDDNVLPPFGEALRDPAAKKLIVVHLLGTHMKYEYRYPPQEAYFTDRDGIPAWADDAQAEQINAYDNAVRFNDKVVTGLIDALDGSGQRSLLLYLSDHGEDVYDTPPHRFIGRNEGRPTPAMYEIPFLIWRSARWQQSHPADLAPYVNRRFQTSRLIHTWADLVGLRFDDQDPTLSLVNPRFVEQPLWVGDPATPKSLIDLRTVAQ